MNEYIERDKALSKEEFFGEHATWDNPMTDGCMAVRSDFIMNLPAADVAPVQHGQWIENRWSTEDDWSVINWHSLTCSACKHEERTNGLSSNSIYKYDYCPWCGARMDGDSDA